jgi:hypothetical protein
MNITIERDDQNDDDYEVDLPIQYKGRDYFTDTARTILFGKK